MTVCVFISPSQTFTITLPLLELRGDLDQPVMHITKAPHCNQVELCGASGADNGFYDTRGRRGASVKGSVHLKKGTQLSVLVVQKATGGGRGGGTFVVFAADGKPLAVAGGGGAAEIADGDPGQESEIFSVNGGSKGHGGNVCVSDAALQSLLGVGGGVDLKTKSMDSAMKMDNATNPVQGTTEVNHIPPVEWDVITRRPDGALEGLVVVGICWGGGGLFTLVVMLKWTGRAKIWFLTALSEEVRLHLIITGVLYLGIALWETVLLRLTL